VAKSPKTFDVWFVAANTVYKGVPYTVVADWVQEGRLAAADMVRPTGTSVAWAKVAGHEFLADYLPRPAAAKVVPATPAAGFEVVEEPAAGAAVPAPAELPEPEPPHRPVSLGDEDDEVDMIPLIDISMVLLVFFIMMRAAGALAPIDVPEMRYAGELAGDPEAVTIEIDKADEFNVAYSVRRGNTAPRPGHGKLPTPEAAVAALDELLRDAQRPPEVRIACRKDLPNDRVTEIQDELEKRLRKNYINSYVATVIEAQKK
jgi:biopolymer transport protein ExbD